MLNGVNGKSVLGKLIVLKDGKCILEMFISECKALHGRISFGHAFIFKVDTMLLPKVSLSSRSPLLQAVILFLKATLYRLSFLSHSKRSRLLAGQISRPKCLP